MTAFTIGERATLISWGRPLCVGTITRIEPGRAVWLTDDRGRAGSFRPDGTSHLHLDHANTHLEHVTEGT